MGHSWVILESFYGLDSRKDSFKLRLFMMQRMLFGVDVSEIKMKLPMNYIVFFLRLLKIVSIFLIDPPELFLIHFVHFVREFLGTPTCGSSKMR